jgi:hypothetical protein
MQSGRHRELTTLTPASRYSTRVTFKSTSVEPPVYRVACDGIISATLWVTTFYRGRSACQFSPQGGMIPMKAFHSEQDLLTYVKHSSPAVVAQPAIVPYINSQLEALDIVGADKGKRDVGRQ